MRRLAALAALATACATTNLQPRTAPGVELEDDERSLWRISDDAQRHLDADGRRLVDADLEKYLLGVATRLEPQETLTAIPFRIRVLKDREPNAFCLPNGAIYVQTGILAAIDSEAQLAMLLGHEMTHATHRHAVRHLRSANNKRAAFATFGALLGAGSNGGILALAAVSGYHRDLEREADREGFAHVSGAGYDMADAGKMFERLRDWAAAENLKESRSFYASHPRIQERIDVYRELVAAQGARPGGARHAEAYAQATATALLENARLELASGRYGAARAQAERVVALRPRDAAPHVLLGEVARRETAPAADATALAAYGRAVELDARNAAAWRGLGLVHQKKGERDAARDAFARYLELAPDAPDAAHVRAFLGVAGDSR